MGKYGKPEIMNADQGSKFRSTAFTCLIKDNGIRINMDAKVAWRDSVFVHRLWRSVKYEEVYLHAYDSVADSRQGLEPYFTFYNSHRPHSGLDAKTPDQVYFEMQSHLLATQLKGRGFTYRSGIVVYKSGPPHCHV